MSEAQDIARIRELSEAWRQAVLAKDANALVQHYANDVVVFDVVPPASITGVDCYRENWQRWFDNINGLLEFDIREQHIEASGDVAFVHAVNRVAAGVMTSCARPCVSKESTVTGVWRTNTRRCRMDPDETS